MTEKRTHMNKMKQQLGLMVSGLVFASQVTAGQVGTTTGSFEVTAGGQSAYTMAVEVPPGIMGVVPQIAIRYSSGGGNGLLGMGANLSGLSSITRCGKTFEQEGVAKAVQYDNTDYFCLNGQRLIVMKGVNGEDGATYQTELESFQKVTSKGTAAGGGPLYFEVVGKGGSKLVFGKALSGTHLERSIDPITQAVASWGISYLEDKHGNRVIYEYQDASRTDDGESASQQLPKRISYGHNPGAGVVGKLAVEFVYETRPDVASGYGRGQKFTSDVRISNIQTFVDTSLVKDYRISYSLSPISERSRISQITECSGAGSCLLPIDFSWTDYSADWQQGTDLPVATLTTQGKMRGTAVDVDNDGHTDWITAVREADGSDILQIYLNHNGSWTSASGFNPPAPIFDYQRNTEGISVSELVDINGDGKVDWVQAYEDAEGITNKVYINNGSDWVYDESHHLPTVLADLRSSSNPKQRAEFIDINGDALPDMVSSYRDAGALVKKTWLNTGAGWQSSLAFATPDVLIDYQLYSKGAATGFFIDINNDGLSDFVKAYKNSADISVRETWLNTGSGWQRSAALKLPTHLVDYANASPLGIASPIDINGDGLLDIVQAHQKPDGSQIKKTWLNTGNGWAVNDSLTPPDVAWQQVDDTVQTVGLFADVSNDGLPDFVRSYVSSSGSQNQVWRNLGDGWVADNTLVMPTFLTQLSTGTDSRAKAFMLDVNSDGRGDLVSSAGGSSSTVYLGGTKGGDFALPEVVTHFSDGLGNAYNVEYQPATRGEVYTPYTDGVYPNIDVAGPMLLVAAVESAVGTTTTSRAEHQYFGKKVHVLGRGDLGFAKKIAIDTRTDARIETEFSQTWPFIGSPLNMVKKTSDGVTLMQSSNRYATQSLFSGKTFIVYQDRKVGSNYELNGQEIDTTTNETTALDAYGNVLSTTTNKVFKGGSSPTTFTSTKTTVYSNDVANWQIGRVTSTTETVTAPNTPSISSKTAFNYDAKGNLQSKIIEPDSDNAVTETYAYDAFGHIRSTSISAAGITPRTTTATYTADGRFAATATNPLGHTAASEYHSFFGQVTRTEGPNGSVTTKLYDDHGRMIKTSKIRTEAEATEAQDQHNNVIVFHPCKTETCPPQAAYFLGVVDNEGESPETVYYDNRNREVRKQTQGFDGSSVYIDTEYDEFGRKYKVSKPYFKDAGTQYWTRYEYDLLGRVIKVITPAGQEITSQYFVGKTVVTNALKQSRTTFVNGQGKPAKVVDNLGQILEYTYDAAGRLLSTVANGDAATQISIEYDAFGRKVKQSDPDLGEWAYAYDALGQLISQQDAKSQVTTMQYDLLGRIIRRTEAEGLTQWQYDVGANAAGKLSKVWNDQGYQRDHVYDGYGRPVEVTTTVDGDATKISTAYHHSTDRVAYVEYPSGLKIAKEFNNYGFPLEIRSTNLDFKDRYLAAEAEATTLGEQANAYQDETTEVRQGWLDSYETARDLGNAEEDKIARDEREYHQKMPTYNGHIRHQQEAIKEAKHFQLWGNSFRTAGINEQRKALINGYAAEYAIAKAEEKAKPWSDFAELGNVYLWPNGGGEAELKAFLTYILGLSSEGQLANAYDFVKPEDLALTAEWMAQHAQNHNANAERLMQGATERYAQLEVHVAAAEAHAKHAETYYNTHLKVITDRIQARVTVANGHYQAASDAAAEINTIDTALKARVDAAVNAQRQAAALKNYYQNEGSELHWLAVSADAEGKVTEFKQGKHVSTTVSYEADTGRLHGVMAASNPVPIELEAGQTIPSISNRLNEFIAELQATQTEAAGHAAGSLDELTQTLALIAALDPNEPGLSPAMQAATEAQIEALRVNQAIFNADFQLNTDLSAVATSTIARGENINASFDGVEHTANNVLVYSTRVHELIANYHSQVKGHYELASQQQKQQAEQRNAFEVVDNDYLAEYASLGDYHTTLSSRHQARADAIAIDDGSEASKPELYGLAKAAIRQKRLIDRHADISNKRRRLNVALFAPLQHLNEASRQAYENTTAANHFADNKLLGRSDRERFKQLERLYRDRLAVLEVAESEDEDLFANDTERKALYQTLADLNAELGVMYSNMSEQSYWDGMFEGFADSLSHKSAVYHELASHHDQLAANNRLLANESGEQYDHGLLGNDDGTLLSDTYEWDELGNLISRVHGAADLSERFEYDALNRLVRSDLAGGAATLYQLNGNAQVSYQYDALGNITYKSDVGNYRYADGLAGPHAVTQILGDTNAGQKHTAYQYDANGNMTRGDGRLIDYTSFNKPSHIEGDGDTSDFSYGPERQLIKQVERTGIVPKTTLYIGSQYQKIYDGYKTTEKYHLSTHNGATIAVIIDTEDDKAPKTHYLHRDHLDSIVAITNEQGYVVERFFYDAFGKQLTAVNPDGNPLYATTINATLTDRGFTGHKSIQSGLIHMGGRVYDPAIGRFLSADPHIQFAGNLQNYNRYSYVNNNPLAFNDPSGYFLSKIFKALKKLFKKIAQIIKKVLKVIKKVIKFIKENLRVVIAVVVAVVVVAFTAGAAAIWAASLLGSAATATSVAILGGAITGAIAGGLSGLIMTGSLSGALKGAALGFVGGAIGGGVSSIGGGAGQAVAKGLGFVKQAGNVAQGINAGLTGGIMGKITGGSFSKGFKTGVMAFGAFKGLDKITGGAITAAGKWLSDKGRAFFGTPTSELSVSIQRSDAKNPTADQQAAKADLDKLVASGDIDTKKIFKSADAAALDISKKIQPITEARGVEIGGNIFENGDGFSYGNITVGNSGSVSVAGIGVAGFHTHPDGISLFSGPGYSWSGGNGDKGWVEETGKPLYMSHADQITGAVSVSVCNGNASCNFYAAPPNQYLQRGWTGDPVQ